MAVRHNTSAPVYIQVKPLPAKPTIFGNTPVCEGDNIIVFTYTPADAYHWTGPNGFTSNLQNPPAITNVTVNNTGLYS
jgi:hypothetical protein